MKKSHLLIGNILCIPVGIYLLYVIFTNSDFDIFILGSLLALAFVGLIVIAFGKIKKQK